MSNVCKNCNDIQCIGCDGEVSDERLTQLIDKYSEDTFADLLDLAHYTIDSVDDIVSGLEELQIIRKDIKNILLEHLQVLREKKEFIDEAEQLYEWIDFCIPYHMKMLYNFNKQEQQYKTIMQKHNIKTT